MAAAPKTEFTPSQPMQLIQFRSPGRTIVLPNGRRATGSWAMPVFGPIVARRPTSAAPTRLPTMIPARPVTNPTCRKSAAASRPIANAAGTRFGVNQTVKTRLTEPYRADAGIGSMPWPSIVRSPSWVGMSPARGPWSQRSSLLLSS